MIHGASFKNDVLHKLLHNSKKDNTHNIQSTEETTNKRSAWQRTVKVTILPTKKTMTIGPDNQPFNPTWKTGVAPGNIFLDGETTGQFSALSTEALKFSLGQKDHMWRILGFNWWDQRMMPRTLRSYEEICPKQTQL